jgi:hypothetical protein
MFFDFDGLGVVAAFGTDVHGACHPGSIACKGILQSMPSLTR